MRALPNLEGNAPVLQKKNEVKNPGTSDKQGVGKKLLSKAGTTNLVRPIRGDYNNQGKIEKRGNGQKAWGVTHKQQTSQ